MCHPGFPDISLDPGWLLFCATVKWIHAPDDEEACPRGPLLRQSPLRFAFRRCRFVVLEGFSAREGAAILVA